MLAESLYSSSEIRPRSKGMSFSLHRSQVPFAFSFPIRLSPDFWRDISCLRTCR